MLFLVCVPDNAITSTFKYLTQIIAADLEWKINWDFIKLYFVLVNDKHFIPISNIRSQHIILKI